MVSVNDFTENFTCGKWNLTEQEYHIMGWHGWWIQGLASIVLGTIGIIVSTLAIIVLSNNKLSGIFFNKLIVCMTSFDIIYLMCSTYDSIRFNFIPTDYCTFLGYVTVFVLFPLRKIVLCCSIYMTIVVAFERYLAVVNPITHRNESKFASVKKRLFKYVCIVVLVSFLYGMPLFFAFKIKEFPGKILTEHAINTTLKASKNPSRSLISSTTYCIVPWLRAKRSYIVIYNNVINMVTTGVIPVLFLVFFYYKINLSIQDAKRNRFQLNIKKHSTISTQSLLQSQESHEENRNDHSQSIVFIWIVISFLVCHTPRIGLNIEEMISDNDKIQTMAKAKALGTRCIGVNFWAMIATDYYYLLLCIHPIMNFFIYCYFNKTFQEVLKSYLCSFPSTFQCSAKKGTGMETCKAFLRSRSTEILETSQSEAPSEKTPLRVNEQ